MNTKPQNKGTIIRLILALAIAINDGAVIMGVADIGDPVLDKAYKWASLVATIIILWINHYYNNDYTPEASEGTGLTRQLKAEKGDYDGEKFFDEVQDEDIQETEE
jgi:hypothetical protein